MADIKVYFGWRRPPKAWCCRTTINATNKSKAHPTTRDWNLVGLRLLIRQHFSHIEEMIETRRCRTDLEHVLDKSA
jgi:hypothetical protein